MACKAVEQVMEWEISGPLFFKSWATQEDIFPKVVVGDANVDVLPVSRNSWWYFSNNCVAPLEEPILIPKSSPTFQPEFLMASRDTKIASKTVSSNALYLMSDNLNVSSSILNSFGIVAIYCG